MFDYRKGRQSLRGKPVLYGVHVKCFKLNRATSALVRDNVSGAQLFGGSKGVGASPLQRGMEVSVGAVILASTW